MFFRIDEETLRRMQEEHEKKRTQGDGGQDSIYKMAVDGKLVIDDPSLVKVVSNESGPLPKDDMDRILIATNAGWWPLNQHPFWGS